MPLLQYKLIHSESGNIRSKNLNYAVMISEFNLTIFMGKAGKAKSRGVGFGKAEKKLNKKNFVTSFKSFEEFVGHHTMMKGRGYLGYYEGKCNYYGKADYVGDEGEFLLLCVENYNPKEEVVLSRQVNLGSSLFRTDIIPLTELKNLQKGTIRITGKS